MKKVITNWNELCEALLEFKDTRNEDDRMYIKSIYGKEHKSSTKKTGVAEIHSVLLYTEE